MYTIPPKGGKKDHVWSLAPERKDIMLRFGLNINDKKVLVKRLGELVGEQPRYTFMPRCAYEIGAYTVERRGDLVVEEADVDEAIIQTLLSEGLITDGVREESETEPPVVSAQAETEPAEREQPEQAEETEEENEPLVLQISLPLSGYSGESLRRLINLLYSRGPLLSKATRGKFHVDKDLIKAMDEAGTPVLAKDFCKQLVEYTATHGGLTGLILADDKVTFTGFPLSDDPQRNAAFQQMACFMNKMALEQKRIQAKIVNDDNEKYAFRIWLLRIGMNGDEYKASRRILMENLSGHTAFRTKDEEARWKARQKEKREELKASKAAADAEETPADAV